MLETYLQWKIPHVSPVVRARWGSQPRLIRGHSQHIHGSGIGGRPPRASTRLQGSRTRFRPRSRERIRLGCMRQNL